MARKAARHPSVLACALLLASGCNTRGGGSLQDFPVLAAEDLARLPLAAPAPQRDRYEIEAALDPRHHDLRGTERITWTNRSTRVINELHFHLYLNAFRKGSRFLDPALGGSRSGELIGREGSIKVLSAESPRAPGENLWSRAASHSPNLPDDQTDLALPLPFSVQPGETLHLTLAFVAELPSIVERTGFSGDFHLLGQWFPKLAKFEVSTGQFAHDSFHPFAEFYADFSDYEVTLEVPSEFAVGSAGRLRELRRAGDKTVYQAHADNVLDFAWTAFPQAHVLKTTISGVDVTLLTPARSKRSRKLHLETIEKGLQQMSRDYGPYPYPTLTVVQPPAHAYRAGGMEYPTFITTGGSELAAVLGARHTELLVIHELGHQWFQSVVATNERQFPFLDEGLNSYAEWRYLRQNYGSGGLVGLPGLALSREAGGRFVALSELDHRESINQPAADFRSFRNLAQQIYARTPLVLMTLGRIFGPERVTRALAEYTRRYRFAHPGPEQFIELLVSHLEPSAERAVRELFGSPGPIDPRLGAVRQTEGPLATSTSVEIAFGRRLGLPIELLVEFADGSQRRFSTPGESERETLTFAHASPVERIVLDPDVRWLIDENLENNRHPRAAAPESPRTQAHLASFTQLALALLRP